MKYLLDRYPGIRHKFLGIAEGGIFNNPTAISTVLGSCVAVTLFCPKTKIGGTFHALLSKQSEFKNDNGEAPYRFVDTAIELLLEKFDRARVDRTSLQCKVFGGGSAMMSGELGAGRRNVQTAFEMLKRFRIRVTASSVGGDHGRKMLFITSTGEAFIKRIPINILNQG